MPKKNNQNYKVVPVYRDKPDLDKLARAIVDIALKQLRAEVDAANGTDSLPDKDDLEESA